MANLFPYSTVTDKCLVFLGSLAAIVHGASTAILALFFGKMTDDFLIAQNISNAIDSRTEINEFSNNSSIFRVNFSSQVHYFCQIYIYLALFTFIMSYIQITCWEAACERRIHGIRKAYFKSILRQEISWFDTHQSGETIPKLTDDLDRVREGNGDKFSLFIQALSTFLFGYLVAFTHSWKLTLVMISLAPLLVLTGGFLAKKTKTITGKEQKKYAIAGGIAKEALSCIRTVLAFNGQKREIERFDNALEKGKRDGIQKNAWVCVGTFSTSVILLSSYGLAFWYGSNLIINDSSFLRGTVFIVFLAVGSGTAALSSALPHIQALALARGAMKVILDNIANLPKIDPHSETGLTPGILKGKIEFENVQFAYPIRKNVNVLKDVNFTINAGQKVAFVGASGSSKSTIVNLLLRYYDPTDGKITIDGYELRDFNVKFLRSAIAVVSQEPILFDGTLEDNIRMGNPEASTAQITEAIKLANAQEFINLLPKGIGTRVGEQGIQLSGGQKQRIAIARALVRNPKILLLDEATSALDTESESLVQQALKQAEEGRTTLTIAHRLSTIRDSDKIFVLSHGNIVEEGTYQDLLEQKQLFYAMVVAQQLDLANHEETIEEASNEDEKYISCGEKFEFEELSCLLEEKKTLEIKAKVPKKIQAASFGKLFHAVHMSPLLLAIGFIGAVIMGIAVPLFAMLYSQIFQIYSEEDEKLKSDAEYLSPMFVALGIIQGVGSVVAITMLGQAGEKITKEMRLKSFSNIIRQGAAYFDIEAHNTGKICTRLATDAPNVRCVFTRLTWILSSCITIVTGIFIAFIVGWKLTLIVVVLVPLLAGAAYFQFQMQCGNQIRVSKRLELAGKISAEAVSNIRTVQALTREDLFFQRYADSLEEPFKKNMRMTHVYGAVYGLSQCIIYFMYATAFYFGAKFVDSGELSPLNVYRIFLEIVYCSNSFGRLSSFIPDVAKGRLSATLMFNMIEEKPSIDSCSKAGLRLNINGQIQLKNVHFTYPTRPTVQVLRGLNLTVEPGQKIALVGPSGCGKSTVISLLQRFYDITQGEITFDGHNLKSLNLGHLRNQIGLVSQEPVLFDCSIEENIAYGLEGDVNHEDIVRAAKIANIHEFILSLPMRYSTNVGEKGVQLSGGQKQRIAIARALIRNPKILLLDEATSALDTESEQLVQEALDNAGQGRTCIVIAHRLSTIQNADHIVVIGNGTVVEQGTHQELLENAGLYSTLCQKQSLMRTEIG